MRSRGYHSQVRVKKRTNEKEISGKKSRRIMGINGREKRNKKKVNGSSKNGIMIERKNEGIRFNRSEMIKKGNRSGAPTKHAGSESRDVDEKESEDPMMTIDEGATSNSFITRIT